MPGKEHDASVLSGCVPQVKQLQVVGDIDEDKQEDDELDVFNKTLENRHY